jgi:hypothetical protein
MRAGSTGSGYPITSSRESRLRLPERWASWRCDRGRSGLAARLTCMNDTAISLVLLAKSALGCGSTKDKIWPLCRLRAYADAVNVRPIVAPAKNGADWKNHMPTFKTLLRAAVMLLAAILIVNAWQLYGPTTQQLKSWTARIAKRVHVALSEQPQLAPAASEAAGNSDAPRPLPAALPSLVAPTPGRFESTEFPVVPPINAESATVTGTTATPLEQSADAGSVDSNRMPMLLARLEQLGAVDPQLAAWGSSGNLYRFCCRAAPAGSPQSPVTDAPGSPRYARHFEAVAEKPLAAVEQVVSKVEAWRTEQGASADVW